MPFKQLERRDKIRFLTDTLRFVTFLPCFCKQVLSTKFLQNRIGKLIKSWQICDCESISPCSLAIRQSYFNFFWSRGMVKQFLKNGWNLQICAFMIILFSEMKSNSYWKWLKHMFKNDFLQGTSESRASSLKSPTKARW